MKNSFCQEWSWQQRANQVSAADWYEPELKPQRAQFARHYGTVILQPKPVPPRHKEED